MYDNSIIMDLRVLKEEFIPSRVLHRDSQIGTLRDDLSPLLDGKVPRNVFLYGSPGVGKTCLAKFVVEELKSQMPILSAYINCWNASTEFNILYTILQGWGDIFIHRKGVPTDELWEKFRNSISKKKCVVILDEADRLESEKVLYEFFNLGVCVIFIANKETALYKFEDRIRSRISSTDFIEFSRYKENEVLDILKDRAEWGLMPKTYSHALLEKISMISHGDSRTAINILRLISEEAERNDMQKIPVEYIDRFSSKAMLISQDSILKQLNQHQRLMLEIISERKVVKPPELYDAFDSLCEKKGLEKMTERSVRNHLEKLQQLKLIQHQGSSKSRVYVLVNLETISLS